MNYQKQQNAAFIDSQNLHQGLDWNIDYKKFRVYLRDKFFVEKAYYFIGFRQEQNDMYENIQSAGFILVFNAKGENLKSHKKGNIDTNLVFHAMKKYIESDFDRAVLVTGDGDFKMMVDYFVEKDKFLRLLAPNMKYCSSLYNSRNLHPRFFSCLNDLRSRLEYKKRVP